MKALIDGDIVCYRCAAVNEHNEEGIARWQADQLIESILNETQASSYSCFLTGGNNFRFSIYPEYKANRRDMVKPRWLASLREHLCEKWQASVSDGCEADDMMGVAQSSGEDGTIICSIDKDMLMIPGKHYNFVRKEFREVFEPEATRWLYMQAIMGDKVDNIPGWDGKMRHTVPKFMQPMIDYLNTLEKEEDMYAYLADIHCGPVPLDTCLKCLYIWREEGDIWKLDRSKA